MKKIMPMWTLKDTMYNLGANKSFWVTKPTNSDQSEMNDEIQPQTQNRPWNKLFFFTIPKNNSK